MQDPELLSSTLSVVKPQKRKKHVKLNPQMTRQMEVAQRLDRFLVGSFDIDPSRTKPPPDEFASRASDSDHVTRVELHLEKSKNVGATKQLLCFIPEVSYLL